MPQRVQLQAFHDKNGHLTEFAGFSLPLWFTGIIPESLAVRNAVGIFDVSHMGRITVTGDESERFLQYMTSNDVSTLTNGGGQYALFCNQDGGIKDDVFTFRLGKDHFLIVYNAANRVSDFNWLRDRSNGFKIRLDDISDYVALFALQGPRAAHVITEATRDTQAAGLKRLHCVEAMIHGCRVLVSRTGYTGEDGFEIFVWDSPIQDATHAQVVWEKLLAAGKPFGLQPCGLGARDVLRLEAGLCLYGTDISERTNAFEARLGFVVNLNKDFIGRTRLQEIKQAGTKRLRVGIVMQGRVIPRHGFGISNQGVNIGEVTSGTLSPVINKGIAMGYVEQAAAKNGTPVEVQVRGRYEPAVVTNMPFYDPTKYGYSRKNL